MSSENRGTAVVEAAKAVAPALSGDPRAVWHAAREGTQRLADTLPNTMGLDRVKRFIHRNPVLTAGIALAVGYFLIAGRRPHGA